MDARKGIDRQNRKSVVSTQPGSSKVREGKSITQASKKTQTKAVSSGSRNDTHFVSLPLAHPALVRKLNNFQDRVTKELGLDKSMFNKPGSLHLTVRMLELGSDELVEKAAKVLQRVSSKVRVALENRPLMIRLKGLGCMRGTEEKAYVINARVEEIGGGERLKCACKVITKAFVDAGLVDKKDAEDKLKLHATLMNASFKRGEKPSDKAKAFDARRIFELYGGEEWGECVIREAHLSRRGKLHQNGYFHCCASIPFPQDQ